MCYRGSCAPQKRQYDVHYPNISRSQYDSHQSIRSCLAPVLMPLSTCPRLDGCLFTQLADLFFHTNTQLGLRWLMSDIGRIKFRCVKAGRELSDRGRRGLGLDFGKRTAQRIFRVSSGHLGLAMSPYLLRRRVCGRSFLNVSDAFNQTIGRSNAHLYRQTLMMPVLQRGCFLPLQMQNRCLSAFGYGCICDIRGRLQL